MSSPSIHWQYPSSGPAPPSPVMVNTVPDYFGGRPTPPPTPPKARATLTVDDYAPCPPSPRCVPSSAQKDKPERSNALNSGTSEPISSGPRNYWLTSELDHSTSFADPLTDGTCDDPSDQAQYDDPHVSDHLICCPEIYASPSPVLSMIQRAALDQNGLRNQLVTPSTCDKPLKLFSLSGGYTPKTGLDARDLQSFMYYAKRPSPSPLSEPECFLSYSYSISSIEAVQRSLRMDWSLVYPSPIPPVIIRSHDIIGPFTLARRLDGFAFVMPTEDSIWPIIRQCGVDSNFRPLDPSATVETSIHHSGDALYWPQHIVASEFAVNVFLQFADSATQCEYLGAYVLQVMENLTIHSSIWADIDPEVQRSVSDRVPYRFEGRPYLPYVRFCYYKWDRHIVGLADEIVVREILAATQSVVDSSDYSDYDTDSGFDTDQDTASTPSAYSPEQEYTSFLDF